MKVNREELLRALGAASAGLAAREVIEQSSCYCFRGGKIITFNNELACFVDSPLKGLEGAVSAKPLLALLSKLAEPEIDVSVANGHLMVKGKDRRSGLKMDAEVVLPIDAVGMPGEADWKALPPEFCDGLKLVVECVADNSDTFHYTCVHLHPQYLEGCDNFQFARYPAPSGLAASALIRGTSAAHIVGLGMTAIAETENWLHFRNASGLILSCCRFSDQYPDMSQLLNWTGTKTTLPGGLAEMAAKAEIFSSEKAGGNLVHVRLKADTLFIKGDGNSGWYEEKCAVKYSGRPLSFMISPKLLSAFAGKTQECEVSENRLRIAFDKAQYVACLFVADPVATPAAA